METVHDLINTAIIIAAFYLILITLIFAARYVEKLVRWIFRRRNGRKPSERVPRR
jgi:hypothetical protein